MKIDEMKNAWMKIEWSEKTKENILGTVRGKGKSKALTSIKTVALSAAVLCLALVFICAVAVGQGGHFKDVFRFDGAVVGTEYVNASTEVSFSVISAEQQRDAWVLDLEFSVKDKSAFPWREAETINVTSICITDAEENQHRLHITQNADLHNGKAVFSVSLDGVSIKSGAYYTLEINEFQCVKKADAPLVVKGIWKCGFETK